MAGNKYYIVNVSNPNLDKIIKVSVETLSSAVKTIDGKRLIVKLKLGDNKKYSFLNGLIALTRDEIRTQKSGNPDWEKPNN